MVVVRHWMNGNVPTNDDRRRQRSSTARPRPIPFVPHCHGELALAFSTFDPRVNQNVGVFECQRCYRQVWENEIA